MIKKSDKTKLKNVTQDLLSRSDGKLEVFKLFENNILDNNQKKVLLTNLDGKNTTAVFNSISVEKRIAFLENLNDGNIVVPDNVTTNPKLNKACDSYSVAIVMVFFVIDITILS